MTYQVFLLFEKENEIPQFVGYKETEEQLVISRYEKLDMFFGKSLDVIIIENDVPNHYTAIKIEELIYETLSLRFPDLKIYRYRDFLDQQKSYFEQANELMQSIYKNAIEGNLSEMKAQEELMKDLLKKYKRGFKRKFTFDQIKILREKFSGSGNNFWSRKHTLASKKKIGRHLKKKKAIYDKARKKIWADINAKRKGKNLGGNIWSRKSPINTR